MMFVRFRLLNQVRSNAYSINDFDLINVRDPDVQDTNIVIFQGLFTLSFYVINIDVVNLFAHLFFVFNEFVLYQCTPSISTNEYHLLISQQNK